MLHIPLLSSPLGWIVLGIGGYALYQAGKKSGEQERARQERPAQLPASSSHTDTTNQEV
ncbi:MAG: hypothetical protein ACOX5Z_09655 [Desulfobulbus sp.]|jgi:hypothetical protein